MAWLLRDGQVLASLERPSTIGGRSKGLLGRSSFEGAMWLEPAKGVHSVGMRFDLDIAWLDAEHVVIATARLPRHRVARPRLAARSMIEAEAGAFARWGLREGDRLEIKETS